MGIIKNNEYAAKKKISGMLLLIFASAVITGCSATGADPEETADKSEQAIRAVIEKEFNGPDEKYEELWDAAMEAQVSDKYSEDYEAYLESPEYQALMGYTEETYASYFTENGYDAFINAAPAFMYSIFDHDYQLKTSAIEIAQNEKEPTLYDFTFQVEYTDENGETEQFNFKGDAIAPEDGKIGRIQYIDGFEDGLLATLQNNE
ncbi:hypothetical protein [Planococcus koreensis]|uniref:hypothetical protein n=1 Tax=Planococcus koreensis TaxID=112331 RepID=UPI0039FC7F8A